MQNYKRIFDYYYEFWKTIYQVYARHGIAYKVTYYRLDIDQTIWDDDTMFNGPYELIGEYSGVKWNKILFLPIYFISEMMSQWEAKPEGWVNPGEIDITIPSDYGFIPLVGDVIKLDETTIDTDRDNNPIFIISGIKKQTHQNLAYWQVHCNIRESKSTEDLDLQVDKTLVFYDYDKKIHTLDDSIALTRILNKNQILRDNLKLLYDHNSGLYFM